MDLENLAARLKALREAKGLTKYRLAKLSKISQTYIYRIERGEIKNPRRDTLQALARGLSITLAQLIGETSPSDTWQLVELSLKAYIPVYAEIGGKMGPVDYVACTRTEIARETVRAYRAEGLHLEPEIQPGDTIIVDTALTPINGDLVVVILEGQPAIKRYKQKASSTWFEDNRGRYKHDSVQIHGIIIEYVRKLR